MRSLIPNIADFKLLRMAGLLVSLVCSVRTLSSIAQDFEFVHVTEADRYEELGDRLGTPELIRAETAPGLLVETGMGVYRADATEPTPIGRGTYALPEGGRVRFGQSVRVYGFGGVGGTLRTTVAAKGKTLVLSVSGHPGAASLVCRVEGPGLEPLSFAVPQKALPADFVFCVSDRGDFSWTVAGLADSSAVEKTGRTSLFEGFWVSGSGYPPIAVETSFVRDGTSGVGSVTLDNRLVGDCAPVQKLDVPAKIRPAETFDPVKEGWPLAFADEFDGSQVDWSKWYFRAKAGHPERDAFCRLDGKGVLELLCDYGPDGTNLVTGSMRSKREFTYGYFESRFKLTRQNGWWAAVWLYGRLNSDPFVDGVEIDIFEDYFTRKRDAQGRNRRQLDHNLHVYLGAQLKSWNFSEDIDSAIDDWIVLGCKRTPFEISYYLNGRLVRSSANHCNWPSVTFDAFSHAAATVPLHIIVSGQVMSSSWPWFDKAGATFPEAFKVDYVRCYEMPREASRLPQVAWAGVAAERDDGALAFFSPGDRLHFDVTARPAENAGAPIAAVYLFDAGSLLAYKTEPPYSFDVEMTEAWYGRTRYMRPGRQKVVPDFGKAPHSFVAFAQDAAGNVSMTRPIRRLPKFFDPATRPYGGVPQTIPGKIVFWRYDEGGPGVAYNDTTKGNAYARSCPRADGDVDCSASELANVMPGEWVNYTVDVARDGIYRAEVRYGTGHQATHRLHLLVDGKEIGRLALDYFGESESWAADKRAARGFLSLARGRHVLSLYAHGQFNLGALSFVPDGGTGSK